MSDMIFITCAYNAEKTIARTIDSVLAQTFSSLKYYVIDNGSSDNTREIISSYAKRDGRIVAITFDQNNDGINIQGYISDILTEHTDGYFAVLDADDTYEPDFATEMLRFTEENRLDIACCCTNHIDVKTNKSLNTIFLDDDIIVSEGEYGEKFPEYFRYLGGSHWGKLYSVARLKEAIIGISKTRYDPREVCYMDFMWVFLLTAKTERIGVRAKLLHNYYIKNDVIYYKDADAIFRFSHKFYKKMLIRKAGIISKENDNYIEKIRGKQFSVFLNSVKLQVYFPPVQLDYFYTVAAQLILENNFFQKNRELIPQVLDFIREFDGDDIIYDFKPIKEYLKNV